MSFSMATGEAGTRKMIHSGF